MKTKNFLIDALMWVFDFDASIEILRNRRINKIRAIYQSNPW